MKYMKYILERHVKKGKRANFRKSWKNLKLLMDMQHIKGKEG